MTELLQAGQILDDKYELVEKLGSGGIGTVFRARQLDLNRVVAIKVIHSSLLVDDEFKRRFLNEAQALSQLSHPNIVRVFSMGLSTQGYPYIVMELLEGKSLATIQASAGRLPILQALRIARELAQALSYVHNHGIVHRDLKPSNIVISNDPSPDTVKLIDFGLARFETATDQKLTRTGELVGTADYMSPEQCAGKRADSRSDIYSLTACLFEMLTGKQPFAADTAIGLLYKHINSPVPSLTTFKIQPYHRLLDEIIKKGMSKAPENRYESMSALREKLDESLEILQNPSLNPRTRTGKKLIWVLAIALIILLPFLCLRIYSQMHSSQVEVVDKDSGSYKNISRAAAQQKIEHLLHHNYKDALDRALQFAEAYKICQANEEIEGELRQKISIEYAVSLNACSYSQQAYEVLKSIPKNKRFERQGLTGDIELAAILSNRGESKQAKNLLSHYIKLAPADNISLPQICAINAKLSESPVSNLLVAKFENNLTQLMMLAAELRKYGENALARQALLKAEQVIEVKSELLPVECQWVLQLIAETDMQAALNRVKKIKQKFPGAESDESAGMSFSQLEKLVILLAGNRPAEKNLARTKISKEKLKKEFETIGKLDPHTEQRKAGRNLIEGLLNSEIPALERCQLLLIYHRFLDEPRGQTNLEAQLYQVQAYNICQEAPSIPRETRLLAELHFAKALKQLGAHDLAFLHFSNVFTDLDKQGLPSPENPFMHLDCRYMCEYKIQAARMLLENDSRKSELRDFIQKTNQKTCLGSFADSISEIYLSLDNDEAVEKIILSCRDENMLVAIAQVCMWHHRLALANLCLRQANALLAASSSPSKDYSAFLVRLSEAGVYLEQGNDNKAKRTLGECLRSDKAQNTDKSRAEWHRRLRLLLFLSGMEKEAKGLEQSSP